MNLNAAVNAAITEAIKPLLERIVALESAIDEAKLAKFIEEELIASLAVTDIVGEDRVAQIERRLDALESGDEE